MYFRFPLCSRSLAGLALNSCTILTHMVCINLLHFCFLFPPTDYRSPHIFTLFRSYNTSQCLSIINFGDKKRYMETSWTRIYWWVDKPDTFPYGVHTVHTCVRVAYHSFWNWKQWRKLEGLKLDITNGETQNCFFFVSSLTFGDLQIATTKGGWSDFDVLCFCYFVFVFVTVPFFHHLFALPLLVLSGIIFPFISMEHFNQFTMFMFECAFFCVLFLWKFPERVNETDPVEPVPCQPWSSRASKMTQPNLDYMGMYALHTNAHTHTRTVS